MARLRERAASRLTSYAGKPVQARLNEGADVMHSRFEKREGAWMQVLIVLPKKWECLPESDASKALDAMIQNVNDQHGNFRVSGAFESSNAEEAGPYPRFIVDEGGGVIPISGFQRLEPGQRIGRELDHAITLLPAIQRLADRYKAEHVDGATP